VSTGGESIGSEHDFLGHPKGLYVCFATELWERFSFFGMKFLLLLYLTKYHLFSDDTGLAVLGAFAGLVYMAPLLGGMLADRYLGMRKSVIFGGILLSIGHLSMAVEGHQAVTYAAGTTLAADLALQTGEVLAAGTVLAFDVIHRDTAALGVFYLAMSLIVLGVGFLKPNISTIVGKLYASDDPRRDSGFMIFYMGINAGAFVATFVCGWLGETYGWRFGFGAAGVGMIAGLISFVLGQKHLMGHAEPPQPESLQRRVIGPLTVEGCIYISALPVVGAIWMLIKNEPVVLLIQNTFLLTAIVGLILYSMVRFGQRHKDPLANLIAVSIVLTGVCAAGLNLGFLSGPDYLGHSLAYFSIILIAVFVAYGLVKHDSAEFRRTVVLMTLVVFSIVFWAMFLQIAGSMTLFADRLVDRSIGELTVTASQLGSLNTGFILLLAIPFAALWTWLGRRGVDPSAHMKFGLGIVQAGLGFGALVVGVQFADHSGQVALIWFVLAYLLLTTGELFLSPVGLSAVTRLSIPNVVGVTMGAWLLATALSETLASRLGRMAAANPADLERSAGLGALLPAYEHLFTFLMWFGLAAGMILIVLSPLLDRLLNGDRQSQRAS
jgi:POT family proton-dependent oligopeptide transporter